MANATSPLAASLATSAPLFRTVCAATRELYGYASPVFDRRAAETWLRSKVAHDLTFVAIREAFLTEAEHRFDRSAS